FQRTLQEVLQRRNVAPDVAGKIVDTYEDVLLKHLPALIDETGSFTASTLASRLTRTFDLMGGAVAVGASELAGSAAPSTGVDLLLANDCDMMICAAGQRNMGYNWYLSLLKNGILATDAVTAPFDSQSSGSVPGEGVGVVLLKRLEDALKDGDTIHGILRGVGA